MAICEKEDPEKQWYVVNLSNKQKYYLSDYCYICKSHTNVLHSAVHPNLKDAKSPPTKNRIAGSKKRSLPASLSIQNNSKNLKNGYQTLVSGILSEKMVKTATVNHLLQYRVRRVKINDNSEFFVSKIRKSNTRTHK